MNWAAVLPADVPTGVVTVIVTVPFPGGLVTVIWVSELTVNSFVALLPKFTAVAAVNPDPVSVTDSPPAAWP